MPRKKTTAGGVRAEGATYEGQDGRSDHPATDFGREKLVAQLRELNERLMIASVRQQELAQEAEQRAVQWDALLDSMSEGVIVVDAAGRLVVANPVARAMLELPRQGILTIAREWAAIEFRQLDGRPLPVDEQPLTRALRSERFDSDEVILVCRDGSQRRIVFAGSAVRDRAGEVTLAIVTFRDVTDLRLLERLKQDYVALISHDLRAPLTVIVGHAQMLSRLRSAEEERIGHHALAILRNAEKMQGMIQDLIETSRLESGQEHFKLAPADLATIADAAITATVAPESRPRVHVHVDGHLPPVLTDRERIERVIENLLSNALKFSQPNTPVEVRIVQRDGEEIVSVTDHGIGIAPEELSHLFEKYFQTPAGARRGGIGLGLYLARLIVEQSGGRIWATSTLGRGSTFSFCLPIAEGAD